MRGKGAVIVIDSSTGNQYEPTVIVFGSCTLSEDGTILTITPSGGGGGGTSNHSLLSSLSWSSSGHTGTANRVAGFNGSGVATYLTGSDVLGYVLTGAGDLAYGDGAGGATRLPIPSANRLLTSTTTAPQWSTASDVRTLLSLVVGTDVQAYDAGLTSLTAADASAGLPYVTEANTWANASYGGMFSVVSGAWKVIGLRETSGPTDLTYGDIGDGQVLIRDGNTIKGVTYSEGFDGFFEEMAGSGIAGDRTFDGSSAVTGWSLASRIYTLSATTTPVEFSTLTIDTTGGDVTLIPKGMPLFAISLIILGSGTVYIDWSGGNASGSTAGVGAAPVSGAPYLGGGSGGAGRTTSGNGNTGSSMTSGTSIASVWAGNGGSAGTGTPRSGGASSSVSRSWSIVYGNLLEAMARGIGISASGNFQWAGGQGGGGGGLGLGVGGSGNSGAGGGGGGKVRLSCRDIDTGTATLVIRSNGGNPSNGNITGSAESGGGQGGYGGAIYFSALSITGSNPVQLIANGANGGNASAIGGAAGAGGDGGGGGRIVAVVPDGMTSKITTSVTGGTKGTTIGSPVTPADDGAAGVAVVRGFGA